jgi:hypothetical protein
LEARVSASLSCPARPRRRRLRYLLVALVLAGSVFCAVTARLFIWPVSGMPARVDAIVMLNGPGDRLNTALSLAWEHRARVVVISRGSTYWGRGSICAPAIPRVRVICFDPEPDTTQGEAEFAGRLASQYHWQSIAVVAIAPQDAVARIRLSRCFSGKIYVVNGSFSRSEWPFEIAYEWAATIRALTLQRSC